MEVLRGRPLLSVADEKENVVLGTGNLKDKSSFPSAVKPALQHRKALASKQVTLLIPEHTGLSAKTPGPSARTPGRRALGDITNAGQGSKAAKTPKLKADGIKGVQTPARKALANVHSQRKAEQGLKDALKERFVEVQGHIGSAKEAACEKERKAVERTANGRRILPGVKLRLSTQEKTEIWERAALLAETGIEHVHVTGQQLEEVQIRNEQKNLTGGMRRLLGFEVDDLPFLVESSSPSAQLVVEDDSRHDFVQNGEPLSPEFKATAGSATINNFDDNDLMRASLDVLPSLSDRELKFDLQEEETGLQSDAD